MTKELIYINAFQMMTFGNRIRRIIMIFNMQVRILEIGRG